MQFFKQNRREYCKCMEGCKILHNVFKKLNTMNPSVIRK